MYIDVYLHYCIDVYRYSIDGKKIKAKENLQEKLRKRRLDKKPQKVRMLEKPLWCREL